ncbi:MAG TPA: pyruvate kinase, partial [Draconibacterium sp.]|nr:pyruvate kinase [Draconibacterium sp.]
MRQTKIVATISDNKCDVDFLQSLYNAGMNVARINTAHVTTESGKIMVDNIRAVSDKIAILVDTKGPEIRTCQT